jgi:hypothetical protein
VRRLLIAFLAAVLLVAGCSHGPSAQQWAASVCGALKPWRSALTDLNSRAAGQMAQTTTTGQTRQNLVALVADARDATETARAAVAAAGVPDVDGGDQVAHSFEQSLAQTRDAYAQAGTDLQALPGDNEQTFYDGVVAVLDRLSTAYKRAGDSLSTLNSPKLQAAFNSVPECQ